MPVRALLFYGPWVQACQSRGEEGERLSPAPANSAPHRKGPDSSEPQASRPEKALVKLMALIRSRVDGSF